MTQQKTKEKKREKWDVDAWVWRKNCERCGIQRPLGLRRKDGYYCKDCEQKVLEEEELDEEYEQILEEMGIDEEEE